MGKLVLREKILGLERAVAYVAFQVDGGEVNAEVAL